MLRHTASIVGLLAICIACTPEETTPILESESQNLFSTLPNIDFCSAYTYRNTNDGLWYNMSGDCGFSTFDEAMARATRDLPEKCRILSRTPADCQTSLIPYVYLLWEAGTKPKYLDAARQLHTRLATGRLPLQSGMKSLDEANYSVQMRKSYATDEVRRLEKEEKQYGLETLVAEFSKNLDARVHGANSPSSELLNIKTNIDGINARLLELQPMLAADGTSFEALGTRFKTYLDGGSGVTQQFSAFMAGSEVLDTPGLIALNYDVVQFAFGDNAISRALIDRLAALRNGLVRSQGTLSAKLAPYREFLAKYEVPMPDPYSAAITGLANMEASCRTRIDRVNSSVDRINAFILNRVKTIREEAVAAEMKPIYAEGVRLVASSRFTKSVTEAYRKLTTLPKDSGLLGMRFYGEHSRSVEEFQKILDVCAREHPRWMGTGCIQAERSSSTLVRFREGTLRQIARNVTRLRAVVPPLPDDLILALDRATTSAALADAVTLYDRLLEMAVTPNRGAE